MTKYNPDELVSILSDRARVGLTQDAAARSTLERIADAAAGDARVAIGMLKRAATIAARDDEDAITPGVLEEALPDAELEIRHRDIEALNAHQKTVFEIIRDRGPITPKRLYDRYEARADNPNKRRTVRSYLRKLAQYDLIEADGQTRDRTYRLAPDVSEDLPATDSPF
ncbi:hypothetical protein [Halopelagius fulvigenes]|uniref:Cdc6 AAA+ ATPase-type lid domain-containing protein n=1 Tax=Halopelagius fulvigenes TaxID=1198324 RepID=A0ABD5U2M3_9EURY